jgi:predicted phosphodiesterase
MIIAIVSDVQVGHEAALWPENFPINKGMTYNLAPHQKILLEYWKDYWTSREVKQAEVVIDLGEEIEGKNKKGYGRSLVTANIDVQGNAYVQLIKNYIRGKKFFNLRASNYHDSDDTDIELNIVNQLKGLNIDATYCEYIFNAKIKETGHVLWATHKGGDNMIYKSTMLDRNSLYFSAIKSKLHEDPDIILYGHTHQHFRVDTATRINLIAPTWKFWHPIKDASRFPYTQPTIGGIVLKFPKNRGQIEVIKKFYPLEHIYSAIREV